MHEHDLFRAGASQHAFTEEDIAAIFAAGHVREYAAGDVVVAKGEPGDSMFIIEQGAVVIVLEGGREVVQEEGTYFGELSFINPDHKRSATIKAKTPCVMRVLDQRSVAKLYAERTHVLFTLVRRACAFLVDKEERLIGELRAKNAELASTLDYLRRTREDLGYQELLAQTDALTGLYNRRCLDAQIGNFMERACASGEGLALLLVDLDHFKPVNDTLGHAAGDAVLVSAGKLLQSGVRKLDLPCRIGGDEFAVLLADVTAAQAQERAEALRGQIEVLPYPGRDGGPQVTASIGGTMFADGEDAAAFMARADIALYAAKDAGRNAVRWAG